MIRIAFVITGLEVGGAEMMLVKLLSRLNRKKFESHVISLQSGGPLKTEIEALGVPVTEVGLHGFASLPGGISRLVKCCREFRPSLLQGWMYHGNLLASIAQKKISEVPLAWSIRVTADGRNLGKSLTRQLILLGARWSSRPKRIIYNSGRAAEQHAELGYASEGASVIPNGFDTDVFRPSSELREMTRRRFGIAPGTFVVGIVGRYNPIKDYASFFSAAKLMSEKIPSVRFIAVGKGVDESNSEIVAQIDQLGIQEKCVLAGNQNEMHEIYPAMDVLVSSSEAEGFPNVLGEALSCGIPCVATDVGDSARVVGPVGIVVPPKDPAKIADAVDTLYREKDEARATRANASRQHIIENYGLDAIVRQYETLFLEITQDMQTSNEKEKQP